MTQATNPNWWTFHGNPERTGFTDQSTINSTNVGNLTVLHDLNVCGPVMSVPALDNGSLYVGTANSANSPGNNGGSLYKFNLETGAQEGLFNWNTLGHEGDTHGFTGMGSTPAVVGDRVYFSAFDGRLYCLDKNTMACLWNVSLREEDLAHNQPITNTKGVKEGAPQAEGWCSPLIVNNRIYVSMGEGENPDLYAFLFCLDADTGNVLWIYNTCKYTNSAENAPNVLPYESVNPNTLPSMFTTTAEGSKPITWGSCCWAALSYDKDLNRVFATTGNPAGHEPPAEEEGGPEFAGPYLPAPGYSYGILSLDADTGAFCAFYQVPPESSYRTSDLDIDFGASAVLFERDGRKVLAAGCKNGGLFILDADTLECLCWRQILPFDTDGDQIPTVDPHGDDTSNNPDPEISNEASNAYGAENFHGTYSTPAIHPPSKSLFIGSGGNNYHFVASGIDYSTTPFLRAVNWDTLEDCWALDQPFKMPNGKTVMRYSKPQPPMYTTPGEAGLSSPAVVNDVVFCSTSSIALYAFAVADGTLLWKNRLGNQTLGYSGGYGYCMGPAICGDYVVAGALVRGGASGGVLRIYGFKKES